MVRYTPPRSATVRCKFVGFLWRTVVDSGESGRLVKVCRAPPEIRGLWQILVDYSGLFKSAKVRRSPIENDFLTEVGHFRTLAESSRLKRTVVESTKSRD